MVGKVLLVRSIKIAVETDKGKGCWYLELWDKHTETTLGA